MGVLRGDVSRDSVSQCQDTPLAKTTTVNILAFKIGHHFSPLESTFGDFEWMLM